MKVAIKNSIALFVLTMMTVSFYNISHAHSALVSSDPVAGSTVAIFPERITLVFNEELLTLGGSRSNYLELVSASSESIELAESVVSGERLTAKVLGIDPGPGSFTVLYRVVSGDGHVIRGEFQFSFEPRSMVDPSDGTSVEVIEEVQDRGNRNSVLVLTLLIGLVMLTTIFIYRNSARTQ